MAGSRTVTLAQVAEHCGVSKETVSHILNNRPKPYSAKTKEAVREAAALLGYRPNNAARATLTGRFGCFGLLLSVRNSASSLDPALLAGIHDEMATLDEHLLVSRLPDEALTDEAYLPKAMRQWMVDGLLIKYDNEFPVAMEELIHRHRLHAVWINSKHDTDAVRHDDHDAAYRATDHLLKLGHRRIGYLDLWVEGPPCHYSVNDRRSGYAEAMKDAGMAGQHLRYVGPNRCPEQLAWFRDLLSRRDRVTAVVCYGAELQMLVHTAMHCGLRVPEDLSVITFDPHATAGLGGVDVNGTLISAMKMRERELGIEAVRMLRRKLENPARRLKSLILKAGDCGSETCAPPKC